MLLKLFWNSTFCFRSTLSPDHSHSNSLFLIVFFQSILKYFLLILILVQKHPQRWPKVPPSGFSGASGGAFWHLWGCFWTPKTHSWGTFKASGAILYKTLRRIKIQHAFQHHFERLRGCQKGGFGRSKWDQNPSKMQSKKRAIFYKLLILKMIKKVIGCIPKKLSNNYIKMNIKSYIFFWIFVTKYELVICLK